MNISAETARFIIHGRMTRPTVGTPEYDEAFEDAIANARDAAGSSDLGYDACAAVLVSLGLAR